MGLSFLVGSCLYEHKGENKVVLKMNCEFIICNIIYCQLLHCISFIETCFYFNMIGISHTCTCSNYLWNFIITGYHWDWVFNEILIRSNNLEAINSTTLQYMYFISVSISLLCYYMCSIFLSKFFADHTFYIFLSAKTSDPFEGMTRNLVWSHNMIGFTCIVCVCLSSRVYISASNLHICLIF